MSNNQYQEIVTEKQKSWPHKKIVTDEKENMTEKRANIKIRDRRGKTKNKNSKYTPTRIPKNLKKTIKNKGLCPPRSSKNDPKIIQK